MIPKKNICILISGNGSNLQAIIDSCNDKSINGKIEIVVSNKADAFGLVRASNSNIKTAVIEANQSDSREQYDMKIANYIEENKIDIIVLAGFMRILSSRFVTKYYGKIINIHPSLLPIYPGLKTHEQVVKNKDEYHGVSVHYVSSELDAGPLIAQGRIKVKDYNLENLIQEIHKIEHLIFPYVLSKICDNQITLSNNIVCFDSSLIRKKQKYIFIDYD